MQEIYVAIATYSGNEQPGVPVLVALGITAELAEGALEVLVDDSDDPSLWEQGGAELHGVAQPRMEDMPFWAVFSEDERKALIDIQEEELRDCTSDVAVEMLQDQDEATLRAMLDVDDEDASSDDA